MFRASTSRLSLRVLRQQGELEKAIAGSERTRLVAWCTASWCGPCKAITPYIEKLAGSTLNVDFIKIDIDEFPEVADNLEVASVPTFVMYRDEKIVARLVGASGPNIEDMVKNNM